MTEGLHIRLLTRFKLVSALDGSSARAPTSDKGWAFFKGFILAVSAPNGRKPDNHRLVLDCMFWAVRTGTRSLRSVR